MPTRFLLFNRKEIFTLKKTYLLLIWLERHMQLCIFLILSVKIHYISVYKKNISFSKTLINNNIYTIYLSLHTKLHWETIYISSHVVYNCTATAL